MTHAMLMMTVAILASATTADEKPADYVAGPLYELNDNGAWSWFMDERAIVDRGKLIVGSVRAVGSFESGADDPNWGNIEISVLDLVSKQVTGTVLHARLEQDDHNGPAFYVRSDGRYLAVYTKHGVDKLVRWRISEPGDPLQWGEEHTFETPGVAEQWAGDSVTYSNLFHFPDGKLYNFHRSVRHEPNYLVSNDEGETWRYGGHVMRGRPGYSPYLKYAYDGRGTLHFVATENHPRNYDNSLYHGFLRDGQWQESDGTVQAPLSTTTDANVNTWDFTPVYKGDADHVAWMCDIELDADGRPYIAFSTQRDGRDLPPRQGGMDHRYHYARYDGAAWHEREIAYAGRRLYPGEDDYTGLAALDPQDPNVVYISTDADPVTGEPLVSSADGKRHYELFRGATADGGAHWAWSPLTANSTVDNLRPIVPKWDADQVALLWMRGTYRANHGEWTTAIVATILERSQLDAPPSAAAQ
jgi:hypothetical protein